MCKESSKTRLLNAVSHSMTIRFGHGCHVHNARNRRSHQPGQSKNRVDGQHDCRNASIIIVGFPMADFVTWVIDNVPSDSIVQKGQNETKSCGSGRHEDGPSLSIDVKQINYPRPTSKGSILIGAFFWKVGSAVFRAAVEGRSKVIGYVQFFNLHTLKDGVFEDRTQNNRNGNGKVCHHRPNVIVATKGGIPNLTQKESDKGSSYTQDKTEQCHSHVFVVFIQFFLLFIVWVIFRKVMKKTDLGRRIANGIQNENGDNQKGKDFVCEPCGILDDAIQIKECCQQHVNGNPNTDPGIKGQEGNIQLFGKFIQDSLKSQYRACSTIDHHWHTRYQTVVGSAPPSRKQQFDSSNVIVGTLSIDGTKCDGGSNHSNEHEEGDSNGLGIECGHFVAPMSPYCGSKVLDNSTATRLGGTGMSFRVRIT
mmetsp:Transcript_3666/g.8445  ORF Transcript_3666/g.8445 Transcript_3666/m.8445 type:complete len:422 (+) Transcript_3666:733-1998(+)